MWPSVKPQRNGTHFQATTCAHRHLSQLVFDMFCSPTSDSTAQTPCRSTLFCCFLTGSPKELYDEGKEGTAMAMVQRCLPGEWWDCAAECNCFLCNVHDETADGKTASDNICGVHFRWTSDPVRSQSQLPVHLFEGRGTAASIWQKKCFPKIFDGNLAKAASRKVHWLCLRAERRDGQVACSWRTAETCETCQPPTFMSSQKVQTLGSLMTRNAVVPMPGRISQTLRRGHGASGSCRCNGNSRSRTGNPESAEDTHHASKPHWSDIRPT